MSGDGADWLTYEDGRSIRIGRWHIGEEWRPVSPWPHRTYVQWGGSGIVLSRNGNYGTAFFEAFIDDDPDADFIRGEGEDVAAAEANAWARYRKAKECRHIWGRRGYMNGVGVCVRCRHMKSNVFSPIAMIDDWRKPLSSAELHIISMGSIDGDPSPGEERYVTRLRLRARIAGIVLPSRKAVALGVEAADAENAFLEACNDALAAWLRTNGIPPARGEGLNGFFDRLARRGLENVLSERESKTPGC